MEQIDDKAKVQWALVASLVAVVVSLLALGTTHVSIRVPWAKYAAALEGTIAFKDAQIQQLGQMIVLLREQQEEANK